MTESNSPNPPAGESAAWKTPVNPARLRELLTEPELQERVLQEYCPISDSIEWQLSRQYWQTRGLSAFVSGDVPYVVNNDGRLSADAAAMYVAQARMADVSNQPPGKQNYVLELGAGSGLFAKQFLDAVRRESAVHGLDLYDRTTYVMTDGAAGMLDQVSESGLLHEHADRMIVAHLQAPEIREAVLELTGGQMLTAVFLNYVLDSLPFTYLVEKNGKTYQLLVQTAIDDTVKMEHFTRRSIHELRDALLQQSEEAAPELIDLYRTFVINSRYDEVDVNRIPVTDAISLAMKSAGERRVALHSYGAIEVLDELGSLLAPSGWMLVNDYGVDPSTGDVLEYQHFSGSVASSLNFSQIDGFVSSHHELSLSIPEVESEDIQSRLIMRGQSEAAERCFRERFDGKRLSHLKSTVQAARELIESGQFESARWKYREALEQQPHNWSLLEEIAGFLMYKTEERDRATELAREAIKINPLATGLWNLIGDALFYDGHFDQAEATYGHTIEIHPEEVRGRLNLAWVYIERGEWRDALVCLADALSYDREGIFREPLLQKQQEVLDLMSAQHRESLQRLLNRFRQHRAFPND